MVRSLRVVVALVILISVQARADDAPELKSWLKKSRKDAASSPMRIAFVSSLGKPGEAPKFMELAAEDFNRVSYIRAVDSRTALWDFKLNKKNFIDTDPKALVFDLTGADTILLGPDRGDWELLRRSEGKISSLVKKKGLRSPTPTAVANWLISALGWDGVVLDQVGDYLLVGSSASILKTPEIQALAVSDSSNKILLSPSQRVGAGLLSLSESDGGLGVFDIVFLGQGVRSIPPGTKLIIEKRKRK